MRTFFAKCSALLASFTTGERVLSIAAFVIGIGVMAVEITASRLLAPYFGASMYVWTSLIVTVLLALSIGYHLGGKAAARGIALEAIGYLSVFAALLLVLGMLVIPRFSTALSGLFTGISNATVALFVGSLFVTIGVFAMPVFLMAMAAPILLKHWSALGDVGAVSGRYFVISTAGSVVGTVAPTLLLVPLIGARATMFTVAFSFLGLALLLLPGKRRWVLFVALAVTAMLVLLKPPMPYGVLAERESPYQLIRVSQQEDGSRYLIFNEGSGVQSVYEPSGGRTGFYFDYAGMLPLVRPGEGHHDALIVGMAGGSVASRYRSFAPDRDISITGVEVDPAVIDIARKYFNLDGIHADVVNEDGRMYLARTAKTYDVIFIDAYSTELYIPPHLATAEFFALVAKRLKPGGVFSMNVNAPTEDSPLLKALTNAVASAYKYVEIVPAGSWNHIVLASDQPFDLAAAAARVPGEYDDVRANLYAAYPVTFDPQAEIFTDDRAPIEFLTDAMVIKQMWK